MANERDDLILFRDPDWFFYMYRNDVFRKFGGEHAAQASYLAGRAQQIRIPNAEDGSERMLEFCEHPDLGKICALRLVPAEGHTPASHRAQHMRVIDLSLPRRIKGGLEKGGCREMAKLVKHTYFGPNSRMSRKRCEAFFEDDSNFDLS